MTGAHDIIEMDGSLVRCRCGRSFDWETVEESRARQLVHRGLEQARAALEGEERRASHP